MKLKQQPEDFQVEERTPVRPGRDGAFAFYLLEKRGWTTPDALQAIRRRWDIDLGRLSYGGLKDRHAWTRQFLTIHHGPKRGLKHHDIALEYLGQVRHPYSSRDIEANRFAIVLRALSEAEAATAQQELELVRREGVPNYYDDQRFGSVSPDGKFVAKAMVLEQYEEALHLALVAPYEHDRAADKEEKAILQRHWRDWTACKDALPRGHARSLVDYLKSHPDDFRGALARLRPDLRGLYLSAYQSHLWNQMLARWLEEHCRPEQLVRIPVRLGAYPMHRDLSPAQRDELAKLQLPLPSARMKDDPQAALAEAVLAAEGLALDRLKLKGRVFREMFFSKGERAALCMPRDLQAQALSDDRNRDRLKLEMSFELPRGCYATMVVKRVTRVGD